MIDEFGTHTENEDLHQLIAAEIAARGPVTFCRFMELALHHPVHGYYAGPAPVIGPRGDYLTSPEISPLFGAMIGRQVAEVWHRLGEPDPFLVVEPGPGNGTLARDLLRWAARAEPALRRVLRYVLVEPNPAQEERQRRLLAGEAGVAWQRSLPEGITGCIVANELLDAFPVHLVRVVDGTLEEAYVDHVQGRFVEVWRSPSTPAIARYFAALGLRPGEGCRAEVNLEAPRWMRQAAAALRQGLILTLDYGYPAARLYAPWRRAGTLLCFYRHAPADDPLARVGRQDITAHVDFTTVARAGLEAGLALAGFTTQREFLVSLGIHDALRVPAGAVPDEEFAVRYRAVMELLEPEGGGRVRVLGLTRGLDGPLRGFAGTPDPHRALFSRDGDDTG